MTKYKLLFILLLLVSCEDEINKGYSTKYPVRFYLETVQCNDLHNTMQSTGIYVSIRQLSNKILVETSNGQQTEITQSAIAKDFRYGLGGLIVGRNYMGEALAFDLSCPTCDRKDYRMTLIDGGYAQCAKCKTKYDLNNYGVIFSTTDPAPQNIRALYRYHIYYDGAIINVSN